MIAFIWKLFIIFVTIFKLIVMSKEIERKFLVNDTSYRSLATESHHIVQGYLNRDPDRTVRVRLLDSQGLLTVKTRNSGATRDEWEYTIPAEDARAMLSACDGPVIDKVRYIVDAGNGLRWEIDEFGGRLSPLIVAEIELPAEDTHFNKPSFIGTEVTGDPRYFNSVLAAQA